MHSTNYRDTLITVSPDSPAATAVAPEKQGTVAAIQHALLAEPYARTSDDLLHAAHLARGGALSREAFFAKPQACLRASPLVKQFGWGFHHDGKGKVALIAAESAEYQRLLDDPKVEKRAGMRSKR